MDGRRGGFLKSIFDGWLPLDRRLSNNSLVTLLGWLRIWVRF
jgi:hypothetical protein